MDNTIILGLIATHGLLLIIGFFIGERRHWLVRRQEIVDKQAQEEATKQQLNVITGMADAFLKKQNLLQYEVDRKNQELQEAYEKLIKEQLKRPVKTTP